MDKIAVGSVLIERHTGMPCYVGSAEPDGRRLKVGQHWYARSSIPILFDWVEKPLTAGCRPEVGHEFISRTDAGGVCRIVAVREVVRLDTGLQETQYLIDSRDERKWYNIRELEENFCQPVLEANG
jgi:hypothetical protein